MKTYSGTRTVMNREERMTYSFTPAVLKRVEGTNHHSMVLTALRGEGTTAYLIGPTKQDKERTAYPVSREEEWTAYPAALVISNKEERTAF